MGRYAIHRLRFGKRRRWFAVWDDHAGVYVAVAPELRFALAARDHLARAIEGRYLG